MIARFRTRAGVLVAGVAVAAVVAVVTAVAASAAGSEDSNGLQRAASRLRTVERAAAAGYAQFLGCVHEPGQGGMGIHFVNGALVGDGALDEAKPEAVMFEPAGNGRLELVGVEYIVPQALWDEAHDEPPTLFGHELHLVAEPNRYGIPAFYELHAWTHKDNPTGFHEDWNPTVTCPAAPDRAHGS